jgi:hypothetical protein
VDGLLPIQCNIDPGGGVVGCLLFMLRILPSGHRVFTVSWVVACG